MVRTRDTIIVLLFMAAVAFLNSAYRGGPTIADMVSDDSEELPEISEDVLGAMQQQVEQHISEESGTWSDTSHLIGCEYIGNYILRGKKGEQAEEPNQVYVVDRVWLVIKDDYGNIIPYYYLVKFSDADLNEAGEWEINPMRNTPENRSHDVGVLCYVNGYGTIDELYDSVIGEQLEQYQCFADIDEEKVAQTDFQQTDLADSELGKRAKTGGEGVTEDGMFEYDAKGDTVTITKYIGQETEVVIPKEIAYRTRIVMGAGAFQESGVTSITLSDSVEEMVRAAFSNITTLEKVYVPGSVGKISSCAFRGCTNLKEVVLEEGITVIDGEAFYDCSSLESIEIPSTVNVIENYAFYGTEITSLRVKSGCEVNPDGVRHWYEHVDIEYYD